MNKRTGFQIYIATIMNVFKCLEIADHVCDEAVHYYLKVPAVRARRISFLCDARKWEAIAAGRLLSEF